MSSKPTQQVYEELQRAYEFFNRELFDGRLPYCLITLQRQHDTYGYFSANQFQNRTDGLQAHEIALNPSYFAVRSIHETLSVLVREMVSLDQTLNTKRDKLPRRRYRNTEWAEMVEAVGLMPTDTGLPGGKRVGDNVQTYIIEGGPFDSACAKLVDEAFNLSWFDRFPPKIPQPQPETDYLGIESHIADDMVMLDDSSTSMVGTEQESSTGTAYELPAPLQNVAGEGDNPLLAVEDHAVADAGAGTEQTPTKPQKPAPPPMKRFEPIAVESLKEMGIEPKDPAKSASKTTFQCGLCAAKAWGKPSLQLACHGSPESEHEAKMMVVVTKESSLKTEHA